MSLFRHSVPLIAVAALVRCSGGSSGGAPPAATYGIGGEVVGLLGSGLVLHSSAGESLPIAADGAFAFTTKLAAGAPYEITVAVQPSSPSQTCVVSNGTGQVPSADVADVAVTCTTNAYAVGGSVQGLLGTGLELTNQSGAGTETLPIVQDGAFAFTTSVESGTSFLVEVATQPSSPPQECTVSGGSGQVGAGDVASVTVNCTTLYTIGGSVTGLAGTLILENNGVEEVTVTVADGTFAFATPLASGETYDVQVKTHPSSPWQTCEVAFGQGTVETSDVTGILVTCTTTYAVGGALSGMLQAGLVLQNDGGDDLAPAADGPFTFATRLETAADYLVTVAQNPPTETCTVANGAGTIASADVEDVVVACACSSGLANCNGDPGDGCETPLGTVSDCAACGDVCALAHAAAACSAGACVIATCAGPFDDCDGIDANGCETDLRTETDCGGCGIACAGGTTCEPQPGGGRACQ